MFLLKKHHADILRYYIFKYQNHHNSKQIQIISLRPCEIFLYRETSYQLFTCVGVFKSRLKFWKVYGASRTERFGNKQDSQNLKSWRFALFWTYVLLQMKKRTKHKILSILFVDAMALACISCLPMKRSYQDIKKRWDQSLCYGSMDWMLVHEVSCKYIFKHQAILIS